MLQFARMLEAITRPTAQFYHELYLYQDTKKYLGIIRLFVLQQPSQSPILGHTMKGTYTNNPLLTNLRPYRRV